MLNDSTYLTAIFIYVGAATIFILYTAWWLGRHWRAGWVTLVVLLLAALLLTPAYPKAGVQTMAPALVVAGFQVMTSGVEGARHALRPLVFMCGGALVVTLLLSMTLFRRKQVPRSRKSNSNAKVNPRAEARARANPRASN